MTDEIKPLRDKRGVPFCSTDGCPQHDGKRCMALGFQVRSGAVCEVAVLDLVTELAQVRAQHKAYLEGFELALSTVEHEKEQLEQEAIRLHSERDQARWQLANAMRTIEEAAKALGGPHEPLGGPHEPANQATALGGTVTVRASSCRDNGQGVCVSCSTVHSMPPASSAFITPREQLEQPGERWDDRQCPAGFFCVHEPKCPGAASHG